MKDEEKNRRRTGCRSLDIWFTKALKANTVQEFEQALD